LPDSVNARYTDGTSRSSHAANTAQRNLRRLQLNRIMNCWMTNLGLLPGVS
jgi:hypothetical protein